MTTIDLGQKGSLTDAAGQAQWRDAAIATDFLTARISLSSRSSRFEP
jgi:hypothetical protein